MNTFGASAPLRELQRHFGFEPDKVVAFAKEQLTKCAVVQKVQGRTGRLAYEYL